VLRQRAVSGSAASPLLTDLVAYWKLDEPSGTRFDSVGTNNLTDIGSVGSGIGKQGNAASFVAANNEYLDGGDILDIGDGSLTVSCWFRTTDNGALVPLIGKPWGGNKAGRYAIYLTSGTVECNVQDAGGTRTATSPGTYNDGNWHLAIQVIDRANGLFLYVDNVLVDSVPGAITGSLDTGDPFLIGFYSNLIAYLDGDVDECGVWERVLTNSEITQLYNGGAAITYPFV
jgi:hypothetical protein